MTINTYDTYVQLKKDQKAEFINNQLINIIGNIERSLKIESDRLSELTIRKEKLQEYLNGGDVDQVFDYICKNCNDLNRGYSVNEQWEQYQNKIQG